jgi:hypothetical protein
MFNGCCISLSLDNVDWSQVVTPLTLDINTIGAWKIGLSGLFEIQYAYNMLSVGSEIIFL